MILSRAQIEKLAEIIRQHTTWFAWRIFGEQEISEKDLLQLKSSGRLPMDVSVSSIKYSYVLGKLESVLKEGEFKNLDWEQLKEAATGRYTTVDKLQIQAAELSAHNHFRNLMDDIRNGLYSRLSHATNQVVSEGHVRETIADKIKTGVDLSQSYNKVANELLESLKEAKRDWGRVASTEMHSARQKGIAAAIIQKEDIYSDSEGVDSDVAVAHDSDMCSDCRRIYYDEKTGNPKIFKLKELMENEGTNYKRPWRVNAKPVIPPIHPHCYGRIRYIPRGWNWNDQHEFTLMNPEESYPELFGKSISEKGDCYRYAVTRAKELDVNNAKVVHGTATHPETGEVMHHAWAEHGGNVYDWQNKDSHPNGVPVKKYYKKMKAQVHNKYDTTEATINMLKHRHWGPWS
jgi:hypothetical protein